MRRVRPRSRVGSMSLSLAQGACGWWRGGRKQIPSFAWSDSFLAYANFVPRRTEGGLKPAPTKPVRRKSARTSKRLDELNEVEAGEEVGDFEGGGVGSVGAVGAVGADAGAEVVADSAGGGFLWVGGAHSVAPLQDGAFGFENHGDDFAGGHEVGELAEERAGFMDGVEAAGFFFCE